MSPAAAEPAALAAFPGWAALLRAQATAAASTLERTPSRGSHAAPTFKLIPTPQPNHWDMGIRTGPGAGNGPTWLPAMKTSWATCLSGGHLGLLLSKMAPRPSKNFPCKQEGNQINMVATCAVSCHLLFSALSCAGRRQMCPHPHSPQTW